jgi:hypothetical protein
MYERFESSAKRRDRRRKLRDSMGPESEEWIMPSDGASKRPIAVFPIAPMHVFFGKTRQAC